MDVIENWAKSMALVANPWDYLLNGAYAAPAGQSLKHSFGVGVGVKGTSSAILFQLFISK